MVERPVKGIEGDFFGIRHLLLENYARNTFERYGVPYVVSILCFDGDSRYRMISCRDAGKIAERFLKALHVAGGAALTPTPTQAGTRAPSSVPSASRGFHASTVPATSSRAPASRAKADAPITRSIPRCAFRS